MRTKSFQFMKSWPVITYPQICLEGFLSRRCVVFIQRTLNLLFSYHLFFVVWRTTKKHAPARVGLESSRSEKWKIKAFTLFREVQSEKNAFTLFREVKSEIKMLRDRDREVKILQNSWQFSRIEISQQNNFVKAKKRLLK